MRENLRQVSDRERRLTYAGLPSERRGSDGERFPGAVRRLSTPGRPLSVPASASSRGSMQKMSPLLDKDAEPSEARRRSCSGTPGSQGPGRGNPPRRSPTPRESLHSQVESAVSEGSPAAGRRPSRSHYPAKPPELGMRPPQPRPAATPMRSDTKLEFFSGCLPGMRNYMEDRTLIIPELPGNQGVAIFGVFDGHGGSEVAELATRLLPKLLSDALARCKLPEMALRECFARLDKEIHSTGQDFDRVGSTANVVLSICRAGRMRLFCANCGDTRAVLSRAGVAMDLSYDHSPQVPAEERRIEAAGGHVVVCETVGRVDGRLAVSRALGDFKYKARSDLAADKQKVIAVPDVKEVVVGNHDEYVVIGSDGIFNVLSSEELVSMLGRSRRRGDSWDQAIQDVLEHSVPGGDNVSLCVAQFVH
eukprot:TRINITY_DN78148_c0_g1_i1.p1 TRINITY_DN78148_c0_g1~~TRINITY_DN78148_c0_g1_i1.p1  ORF type:complete len:420 (+),score=69.83 TRINITY_DN78148_c0_g1_i1:63-1322(+)